MPRTGFSPPLACVAHVRGAEAAWKSPWVRGAAHAVFPTACLVCRAVGSASKLMELVRGGLQLRAKHPTVVHADSSRSHLIITVTLTTAACSDSIGKSLFVLGQWQVIEKPT